MKLLICNDDGVKSSGILASYNAVKELGEVTIAAPSTQQSGIGRALTLFEPLRIEEVYLDQEKKGYGISGTPTDAITLGIFKIMDEKPDIVISGINIGYNIGKGELTTSGTLGAAMEAASHGIPTIAVSQQVTDDTIKFENGQVNIDFSFAEKILNKVVKIVLEKGIPEGVDLLNLNIPANPSSEEIYIVELGERMYNPIIHTREDPRGKPYYWIGGEPFEEDKEGTDSYSLKIENKICLTPLTLNCATNLNLMDNWLD